MKNELLYIWSLNIAGLTLAQVESMAGIISFAAATGYTLYKWYLTVKKNRKNKS